MNLLLFIIVIVFSVLTSCQSNNFEEVLKTSKTPRLDMVYFTVIKTEMEELGSFAIVDRTLDTTSTIISDLNPSYADTEKVIYWKKAIFPNLNYINGDSLESYIFKNPEKYWELSDKYKSGWIELSVPYFSKDKKNVLIEVKFLQGKSFGATSFYLLEWSGKEYKIVNSGLISIS